MLDDDRKRGASKMISDVESPGQLSVVERGDALPGHQFLGPLTRRAFWLSIVMLETLNLVIGRLLLIEEQGQLLSFFTAIVVVAIAWVVGARFRDVGWPRWLGVATVFVITLFLPFFLGFIAAADLIPGLKELLAYVGIPGRGVMIMLFIAYVIAGTPPSRRPAIAARSS
jgi:hypothetical protein